MPPTSTEHPPATDLDELLSFASERYCDALDLDLRDQEQTTDAVVLGAGIMVLSEPRRWSRGSKERLTRAA